MLNMAKDPKEVTSEVKPPFKTTVEDAPEAESTLPISEKTKGEQAAGKEAQQAQAEIQKQAAIATEKEEKKAEAEAKKEG
jgi:hypothetical protein